MAMLRCPRWLAGIASFARRCVDLQKLTTVKQGRQFVPTRSIKHSDPDRQFVIGLILFGLFPLKLLNAENPC